ncbi:MAG: hypothetical protein GY719_07340 [bacterium]|nr:hypothetical protein [bacterium]
MSDRQPSDDEFYTGYLPTVPPGIARRVRAAVVLALALSVVVALVLVFGQRGFSAAVYEFLVFRDFEGVVEEDPYPTLAVHRPGRSAGDDTSRLYLVGPGKLGADEEVEGLDGQAVRLRGSLIYRDDQTMVEVERGSVKPLSEAPADGFVGEKSLGVHTLRGMIVDTKCYFGIMKPGGGKPHRACATRCIAGGIPPVFVVSDTEGLAAYLMLVGADGRAVNQEVLDLVAEPLEITGEIVRLDNLWILKAEPADYHRML